MAIKVFISHQRQFARKRVLVEEAVTQRSATYEFYRVLRNQIG